MSIEIGDYTFRGPYSFTSILKNKSGVYAIIDEDNELPPLDVGESSEVRNRVENHDRENCWKRNSDGSIKYAVKYTPNKHQLGRREIEQDIRDQYNIPCGDQ